MIGETEIHAKFWSENLKGRDHLGKPKHGWQDNIKVDLEEIGCGLD
jgi:hypothetical protein